MTIDARPTPSAPDDDPYLWLEEIEGAAAIAWVDEQNAATLERFGGSGFISDRDTLTEILDRPDNIPFIGRRGARVFNFWKDAEHPRGLWRSTTLDSFRTGQPAWDILLDLDRLAEQEKEDWVWRSAVTLPPDHERAILQLSRGGSDAVVLREFNLRTRDFVADGFILPEAKGYADWLDKDTLLVSSALGEGMATRSGYARTTRIWKRGQDISQAQIIHEVQSESMALWARPDRSKDSATIQFFEYINFFEISVSIGDPDGVKAKLDLPGDIECAIHGDWLAVKRRSPWTIGAETYAQDTLLGIGLRSFIEGQRDFHVLYVPSERRALGSFTWVGDRLLLSILDDMAPTFEILDPSRNWASTELQGLPKVAVAQFVAPRHRGKRKQWRSAWESRRSNYAANSYVVGTREELGNSTACAAGLLA